MCDVLLATKSFDLMAIKHKDAGAMYTRWMTDEQLLKTCPWLAHKNVDETHAFVTREEERENSGGYYAWGLFLDDFSYGKNRPRLFGYATLEFDNDASTGSVFVVVSREEQRKGYAMEALCAITNFAFSKLDAKFVTAAVPHFNVAGRRLLERVGFVSQYQFPATWRGDKDVPMLRYSYSRAQYEEE